MSVLPRDINDSGVGGATFPSPRVYGPHMIVEAIREPGHHQHEELTEWLGSDFDPEAFSLDAVNRRLACLQRRRSKTATADRAPNPSR